MKFRCKARRVFRHELRADETELVCDAESREDAKDVFVRLRTVDAPYVLHPDLRTVKLLKEKAS